MVNKKTLAIGLVIIAAAASGTGLGIWIWNINQPPVLTMQTTTSLNDSGLLDVIAPAFEEATGIHLRWVSVGTSQALLNIALGQGDVVMVHSKTYEMTFINHTANPADTTSYRGWGIMRATFAYNYFLVVGPAANPAGVNSSNGGVASFLKINTAAQAGLAKFASRGDGSGTQSKENSTWIAAVGAVPTNTTWYKSLGKGMADTLTTANEIFAYTLTDYGTWLKMNSTCTNLVVLSSVSASDLKNTYSVIAVDPAKNPNVNFQAAKKLVYFMVEHGQAVIDSYLINGLHPFTKFKEYNSGAAPTGTSPSGSALDEVYNGTLKAIVDQWWIDNPTGSGLIATSGTSSIVEWNVACVSSKE